MKSEFLYKTLENGSNFFRMLCHFFIIWQKAIQALLLILSHTVIQSHERSVIAAELLRHLQFYLFAL